jgi:hypothetical protein
MSHVAHTDWCASLERVDPSKGYIPGNVVLCCAEANHSKQWSVQKCAEFLLKLEEEVDETAVIEQIRQDALKPARGRWNNKKIDREILIKDGVEHHLCTKCKTHRPRDQFGKDVKGYCKPCERTYNAKSSQTLRHLIQVRLGSSRDHSKQRQLKINAGKRRGEAGHTLMFDEALEILINQKGRCFYSLILMSRKPNTDWMMSLERLDATRGYHKDNVVWVCVEFNVAERYMSTDSDESAGENGGGGWNQAKVDCVVKSLRRMRSKQVQRNSLSLSLTCTNIIEQVQKG